MHSMHAEVVSVLMNTKGFIHSCQALKQLDKPSQACALIIQSVIASWAHKHTWYKTNMRSHMGRHIHLVGVSSPWGTVHTLHLWMLYPQS